MFILGIVFTLFILCIYYVIIIIISHGHQPEYVGRKAWGAVADKSHKRGKFLCINCHRVLFKFKGETILKFYTKVQIVRNENMRCQCRCGYVAIIYATGGSDYYWNI